MRPSHAQAPHAHTCGAAAVSRAVIPHPPTQRVERCGGNSREIESKSNAARDAAIASDPTPARLIKRKPSSPSPIVTLTRGHKPQSTRFTCHRGDGPGRFRHCWSAPSASSGQRSWTLSGAGFHAILLWISYDFIWISYDFTWIWIHMSSL